MFFYNINVITIFEQLLDIEYDLKLLERKKDFEAFVQTYKAEPSI